MATTPKASWVVHSIFDPDDGGADFAYTDGLAEHGLPELHLWARPSEGLDPGDDWALSPRDRQALLGDFAELVLAGKVAVGSELTREFDGGATTGRFRFDPPVEPAEVEAFAVREGAMVVPVRWSLHRQPEGELGPADLSKLPPTAMTVLQFAQLAGQVRLQRDPEFPREWLLPDGELDFGADQRFGPLTPFVISAGGRFAGVGPHRMIAFARNVWRTIEAESDAAYHLAGLAATARAAGRSSVLEATAEATDGLVDRMLGTVADHARWHELRQQMAEAAGVAGRDQVRALRTVFDNAIRRAVHAHLAGTALLDVMSDELHAAVLGPWAFVFRAADDHTAPDDPWQAPEAVRDRLAGLLTRIGPERLADLTHEAELVSYGTSSYQGLYERLLGLAITSAAATPRVEDVLSDADSNALEELVIAQTEHLEPDWDAVDEAYEAYEKVTEQVTAEITGPLSLTFSALTAAMVHGDRLEPYEIHVLAGIYEPHLPGIRVVLTGS